MAIKVTLREKPISKGRKSLYLDFYPPIPHPETGKPTRREFLGLYLFNRSKNAFDKKHNEDTKRIAESIRQKRENHLNKPEIYSEFEKEKARLNKLLETDFLAYIQSLADKRNGSNYDNWNVSISYLTEYSNGELKVKDLTDKFVDGFRDYLMKAKSLRSGKRTISRNTAVSYFNKFKAALKEAYREGILQTDLNARTKPIKAADTKREYLTLEELNRLVKTPCNVPLLKRAALFSALTGLRFSDIQKMKWGELQYIDGQGYYLSFQQKKTKGEESLPISDQAYSLTEGEENPSEMARDAKVFSGLKYSAYNNKHLSQWIEEAGITKQITFHCFRHTFATLQLFNGTDIYTVSKMLGHRDLKTTQVYAKIVDQAKRKAADSIKLDL